MNYTGQGAAHRDKGLINWKQLICIASVSVVFGSEEKSKKDGLNVLAVGKVG